jgi:hypothetical protein
MAGEPSWELPLLPPQRSLSNQILNKFAKSTFDGRPQDFLPDDCISGLVTEDTIKEELQLNGSNSDEDKELVEWIHTKANKVFAITVQCDLETRYTLTSMKMFKYYGFDNSSLPIENPRPAPGASQSPQPNYFHPSIWVMAKLYRFYESQWKYLAPVFAKDGYTYDLSSECILPFIWKDEVVKEGAFSCVYKVKIHPAHQKRSLNEGRLP